MRILNNSDLLESNESNLLEKANWNKNLQPPLTVLALSMNTITTKDAASSEIASISCVLVPEMDFEKNFENGRLSKSISAFCCVRPLKDKALPPGLAKRAAEQGRALRICSSEREMLGFFLAKLLSTDPDVVVAHNLYKHHLPLLLARMKALKVINWSRLTRLRRSRMPFPRPMERGLPSGRLYVDTWASAIEFSFEKTYSLSHLAKKYFGMDTYSISPTEMKSKMASEVGIFEAIGSGCNEAFLTIRVMSHLSVLPLTKQLTQLCGNLWSGSLQSKRAERNDFLLLHEFHRRKHICPEKRKSNNSYSYNKKKARYSGGLVLEPQKGLYDKLVLLLDYASLYPSIIIEHDICFTTISQRDCDAGDELGIKENSSAKKGVLPEIVKKLLERRGNVKKLMNKTVSERERGSLDIRQKALKLVANSIYGCLGFERSRFYCKEMASLITLLGRKSLLAAKNAAEDVQLEPPPRVIYGDTDSIMVATGLLNLARAKRAAMEIIKAVNKRHMFMRIELDGIFRNIILLQKKKYAAKMVVGEKKGKIETKLELKGIDLVRREWCNFSKKLGSISRFNKGLWHSR
ncbi:DNA polymerase alpha catalytic subunit [Bonamia ostreae]|uniref:DNA polymerase n=1 Tax=Bonamia ostreae TaxID=126728 RepID=A0ABV2AJI3_9EUKA